MDERMDAWEADRIEALRGLEILDTPPEEEFDSLVRTAAAVCGTPQAFLTLVDADRLWIKARHGFEGAAERPRSSSFCNLTIAGDDVLEVHDARLDRRFSGFDVVRNKEVRFYAGAPIRLRDGRKVGAVCVTDTVARRLDPSEREILRCLALAAARSLEARQALMAQNRTALSLQFATAALDESHTMLRRHYEAMPAMLHAIDVGGRLLMVSDLWLTKLGYARHEVIGRLTTDFMTEESGRKARDEMIPLFFREGRCSEIAYQMVAKDGSIMDVLLSAVVEWGAAGKARHSLTVIDDVTERLRTARALSESETRYRRLAEATNDVITQVDMDLVRRYASPACRFVLGYEPEEMVGRRPGDMVHPDDVVRIAAVYRRLTSGTMPGDRTMVTYRKRHKRGHWIWVEAGLNLVRDPDGTPRHMICALRDVTERRRIAEELEAARAAAERAVQTKNEFLANMSHELRTPLTGLLGLHDLLALEPDLLPRHRGRLALAQEAGRSLMAVINDVLDFSKLEAGQVAIEAMPFDLAALVSACRNFAAAEAARKGLSLDAETPSELCLVGDPTRLRQVLLNLVGNAIKFTTQGRVGITARYCAEAARLRLSVTDTGIGIPPAEQEAIFERFRQADGSITRQYGGSGLGLSICKRLVELMGGTIGVESTPGLGSTFTVEVPATAAPPLLDRQAEAPLRAATPRRVLLAEDNRVNGMIIVEMLQHAGHRVMVVENGEDAMARLAGDGPFDLVLMDVQMPVLDGFSATRAIRALEDGTAQRMPIVGLTANASPKDEALCAAAGMDAHVAKPINWADLLRKIDQLSSGAPILPAEADLAPPPVEVLDRDSLVTLAGIIGPTRLDEMLDAFMAEVRTQLVALPSMGDPELLGCAHGWTSMAGHFGFTELQCQAAAMQRDARAGHGAARVEALRAAAERALLAAAERASAHTP